MAAPAQATPVGRVIAIKAGGEQRALVEGPMVRVDARRQTRSGAVPGVVSQAALAVRIFAEHTAAEAPPMARAVEVTLVLAAKRRAGASGVDHVVVAAPATAVDQRGTAEEGTRSGRP
jgi:hypothetical protein